MAPHRSNKNALAGESQVSDLANPVRGRGISSVYRSGGSRKFTWLATKIRGPRWGTRFNSSAWMRHNRCSRRWMPPVTRAYTSPRRPRQALLHRTLLVSVLWESVLWESCSEESLLIALLRAASTLPGLAAAARSSAHFLRCTMFRHRHAPAKHPAGRGCAGGERGPP